ncbi:MAG TPA: FkbM family methyltransferase [Bacteroidia bacterium]|nr:FkbM family methyltransferase [Bacteroidia bacterium]QQR95820.1 MAG: FkbM family methyltransferase [Bacteroidota bacterium]MBP7714783.1 FkbM family methyltransferase [Bacteroidia bacterium]MBP8668365.1 FkbM family methyltransferase [Bacteroidia bacterium]HQW16558.1 FkbM family methyltransferase [Bacteroidia bacterium]
MSVPLRTQLFNVFRLVNRIPKVEKWLVKQSKSKNSFARKLIGNQNLYSPKDIRICTRHGINYQLQINDYLDHGIYFGMHDLSDFSRTSLLKNIQAGMIVFDIGANIGDSVLQIAKKLNGTGSIYAFEPSPDVFQRLNRNVSLNNFNNIETFNLGMADVESQLSFVVEDKNHSGGAFISKDANNAIKVAVTTIDKFVAEHNLSKLDFLKIDTEGFEVFVLKGGVNTFRNFKPKMFIEVSDSLLKRAGSSAKELIQILNELNYHSVRVDTQENITEDYNFAEQHFDIYCTPLT